MVYLENNVIYSFILSGLLFAQRIFRFYEKAEVPLLPNYLGIGFWPDAFLCQKFFRFEKSIPMYISDNFSKRYFWETGQAD